MSEQANVPAKLREGIDAAKRGDKLTARRLLQQVLSSDGDNELALMWMASVVDTLNERRFFLERALSINPKNDRAREALRRLGVETPETARRAPPREGGEYLPPRASGGRNNVYLVAAAVVAFIVIAVIVASVVSSNQPQPTPTSAQSIQLTFAAMLNPTATRRPDLRPPTLTVLPGIIVTMDQNLFTPLPPTFTLTPSLTPSATPLPSATPPPLKSFTILYSDIEQGAAFSSLYQGSADGTGEVKLQAGDTGGFSDITVDHAGQQIAFVRAVNDENGNPVPQLFVGTLAAPQDAKPITKIAGTQLAHPSWSPDGTHIVFMNDSSGAPEIWRIDPDGNNLVQITNSGAHNADPSFSPDGRQIVFTSDLNSPGFSEIFVMDANGGNVTALTDVPNSYSPAWSPDGTRVAYVNDKQGDGDIYVMDADGQRPTLLTVDDSGAEDRTPVWSPDGRWILFASNRDGEAFRWYAIDLQGNVQAVTVSGRNPQSLTFVTH